MKEKKSNTTERLLKGRGSELTKALNEATEAELRMVLEVGGRMNAIRRERLEAAWRNKAGLPAKKVDPDVARYNAAQEKENEMKRLHINGNGEKKAKLEPKLSAEESILKVTGAPKRSPKEKDDQKYLNRLIKAVDRLTDAKFEKLSPKAAKWFGIAAKAYNADKKLPKF